MNIHEIAEKYRIPIGKLRNLERAGLLKAGKADDPDFERAAEFRRHMKRNPHLTVAQILDLVDDPAKLDDLGAYSERARAQLEALGDIASDAAPVDVTAYLEDTARGNVTALAIVRDWIKRTLPHNRAVAHHWIGARLLAGLTPRQRETEIKFLVPALLRVRQSPEFAGWYENKLYRRPVPGSEKANESLDL